MVTLQLKLKQRLSKKEVSELVARAAELAMGGVKPLVPESSDRELQRFYVIEAANERAAQAVMSELPKLKGVEYVDRPAARTMKT